MCCNKDLTLKRTGAQLCLLKYCFVTLSTRGLDNSKILVNHETSWKYFPQLARSVQLETFTSKFPLSSTPSVIII